MARFSLAPFTHHNVGGTPLCCCMCRQFVPSSFILTSTLLYKYTTIYFSDHLLDIWVVSGFGNDDEGCRKHSCTNLCVDLCFLSLLRVGFLD